MESKVPDVHSARGLRRVAVEQDIMPPEQGSDARQVLNSPNLIVNRHYGSDKDRLVHHSRERLYVHEALSIHWNGLHR